MRKWLADNAEPLQAVGALATAIAAVTALVIVPYQVSQSDRIQRDQTAREIYREFLNLTVQKPELASANYCTLTDPTQITAYTAYVEYLLYTSEQMIDTSDSWQQPMASYLRDHMNYLCTEAVWDAQSPEIRQLVADVGLICKPENQCG